MPPSQVFFDANVLLEVILARPKQAAARKVIKQYAGRSVISALTAHLVVHFGLERTDMATLRAFLDDYEMLALEPADFEWAFTNARDEDFEDALQLAVAIRSGQGQFLTFDKSLYETYKSLPNIKTVLLPVT